MSSGNNAKPLKSFTVEEWRAAQEYEFRYAQSWMDEYVFGILKAIKDKRFLNINGCPDYVREFFRSDMDSFWAFMWHIYRKVSMEICSGPVGALSVWRQGTRIIVDPLVNQYADYQKRQFGESVFDGADTILVARPAEEINIDFVNQVDGCIVIRNSLDHCLNPRHVIDNIGLYARAGCALLFWSELRHTKGADEGHRDVCETPEEMKSWINRAGFEIIYDTPRIIPEHLDLGIIEYGCFARKKT